MGRAHCDWAELECKSPRIISGRRDPAPILMVTTTERLLSEDDNILAICLMDSTFNIIETASRQFFERKFAISDKLQKSASAFAATMFGMSQMIDETFGETKSILVDHGSAKTILLRIPERGFVGMVLNTSANADYIALKIASNLEPKRDIEHYA